MENQLQTNVNHNLQLTDNDQSIISNIVLNGDISQLEASDKVKYYNMFCRSLSLNPVTQPFQIIKFQGKERLYATKDATEQLRKVNGVSVIDLKRSFVNDLCVVDAKVQDHQGRVDMATGAVNVKNLKGDALANAIMKTETKAKRRATLSICGLGALDESELETMPEHTTHPVGKEPSKNEKDPEPVLRELTEDEKNALRKEYESIDVEKVLTAATSLESLWNEMHALEKYMQVLTIEEKTFIGDTIKHQRDFIQSVQKDEQEAAS